MYAHVMVLQHKDGLISVEGDEKEVQNRLSKYTGSAQRALPHHPSLGITAGTDINIHFIILSSGTCLTFQLLFA